MEGNNRGRGRRVPCECLCPPDSTAHALTRTHTHKYVIAHVCANESARTHPAHLLRMETSDPFDCRRCGWSTIETQRARMKGRRRGRKEAEREVGDGGCRGEGEKE